MNLSRARTIGIVLSCLAATIGLAILMQAFSPRISPGVASLVVALVYGVAAIGFVIWWQRQTSHRLAESEDRFRLLFEHSGVGMALLSPEGDFLQVNPALVQMLGYPAETLLGRHVTDLMYAEDRSSGGTRPRPQTDAPHYEKEKRFLHRTGRIVWSRLLRVPIRDLQGAIRYYATIFIDVTERKQAEDALAASEKRLRLRFQQAFDGICLWSPAGQFLDANPALCRLLGMSRGELLGRNVSEMAVDTEAIRRHLRAVLEWSGNHCETRLLSRGGSPVDVEVNSAVIEVEEQRLILGICRDISARKRAEVALRQTQLALRAERDFIARVLQTAEALIVVLDAEGCILRFNDKCRSISGRSEEEVRGRPFWECVLPERVIARARQHFQQLLAGTADPSETFENPWSAGDGGERLIGWRCSLIRDEQGQVRHVIGVGLDVTEQRQLEEQVIRARKMETLGTLVGGIAHDFNNQLTAILGNLDMARGDLEQLRDANGEVKIPRQPAIEEILPCVHDAERAAQRCARMTARLLTFSRGRVGAMQSVALDQLVREMARTLQHELPGIQVEVCAPPGVLPVMADVTQLQELLLNLTANARDAMPDGGTLTLTLANRTFRAEDCTATLDARPGSFVELCARDTGRGMTPEVRERIFEPFFTTKKPGQGAGMGLSIVFGIVKGHKGWITVHSEAGAGASFHIYLPTGPVQPPTPLPPTRPTPALAAGGRILVVDDERIVRDLARISLEREGFQVLTAADGEQALDIYRREGNAIDLVLLDYSMPGMNGVQALKELAHLNPDVCAIFCSGYHTDHEVNQMLAAGGRAFVPKPYHPRDIVQAIRQVLAQKRDTPKMEP